MAPLLQIADLSGILLHLCLARNGRPSDYLAVVVCQKQSAADVVNVRNCRRGCPVAVSIPKRSWGTYSSGRFIIVVLLVAFGLASRAVSYPRSSGRRYWDMVNDHSYDRIHRHVACVDDNRIVGRLQWRGLAGGVCIIPCRQRFADFFD